MPPSLSGLSTLTTSEQLGLYEGKGWESRNDFRLKGLIFDYNPTNDYPKYMITQGSNDELSTKDSIRMRKIYKFVHALCLFLAIMFISTATIANLPIATIPLGDGIRIGPSRFQAIMSISHPALRVIINVSITSLRTMPMICVNSAFTLSTPRLTFQLQARK